MDTKPLEECRLKGFFFSSSVHQTPMRSTEQPGTLPGTEKTHPLYKPGTARKEQSCRLLTLRAVPQS